MGSYAIRVPRRIAYGGRGRLLALAGVIPFVEREMGLYGLPCEPI
jgi:hypothetical protein